MSVLRETEGDLLYVNLRERHATVEDSMLRKRVVIFFNEHARELITGETALRLAQDLCGLHADTKEMASAALKNSDFTIVPIANPLGRLKVESGDFCYRTNENGVDLNRNWNSHFLAKAAELRYVDSEDGSEEDGSDTWGGLEAFSEPETRGLRSILERHAPDTFATIHSGIRSMMIPPGYTREAIHDDRIAPMKETLQELKATFCPDCITGITGQEIGYVSPGNVLDYAFEELAASRSFAFEIYEGEEEESPRSRYQAMQQAVRDMRLRGTRGRASPADHIGGPVQHSLIMLQSQTNRLHPSTMTSEECFRNYNPPDKDSYDVTTSNWSKALMQLAA